MKNVKKVISVSVAGVVMVSSFPAFAADVTKNETVYVNLDEQGGVSQVIVSDWLHANQSGLKVIDQTNLENIINVKGEEQPELNGNNLTWNMASEDLFYQGTTNEALPLDVKVTYFLEGKEISGKELIGKSGQVEIHLEIINKESMVKTIEGKERTLYTLFETASVLTLPMDQFKNVEINTGKMISDGNNNIITYVAIPGLTETIGDDTDFIDVPNKLVVKAEATEFEMGPIMITAMSKFPEIEDIKELDKMSDLIGAVESLNDAAVELLDASKKLNDGQQLFASKVGEFRNGFKTFESGSSKFLEAISKLSAGANKANEGAKQLADGLAQLDVKSQVLVSGLSDFANGGRAFAESAGQFAKGAAQLAEATTGLTDKTAQLHEGAKKVSEGATALKQGQAQVTGGLTQSVQGVAKLKMAVAQSKGDKDPLYLSLVELEKNLAALEAGSKSVGTGLDNLSAGQVQVVAGLEKLNAGVQSLKPVSEKLSQGSVGLVQGAEKLSEASKQIEGGSTALGTGIKGLAKGAKDLSGGIGALNDGLNQANAAKGQLVAGQSKLDAATVKLAEGSKALADNQGKFVDAMGKFQNEGTGKMLEESKNANASLDGLMEVKDELAALSEQYSTFTGLGDNMDGQVKFVMKTASLKKPKEEVQTDLSKKEEKQGFIEWVKSFFN